MTALLVIPAPIGQLGNRLVHFAHLRAFAIEKNLPLVHTAFIPYADMFIASQNSLFCVFDPNGDFYDSVQSAKLKELFLLFLDQPNTGFPHIDFKKIRILANECSFKELDRLVSPEMRELVFAFGFVLRAWVEAKTFAGLNAEYLVVGDECVELDSFASLNAALESSAEPMILLDGWGMRCSSAFASHSKQIIAALSPIASVMKRVELLTNKAHATAHSPQAKLIGLHVRRGDYAEWQNGKYFFSWQRYRAAADQIIQRYGYKKVIILVCSNETPPTDFLMGLPHFISTEDPIVDLHALAQCDLIIGPHSTFSSWATVLAGSLYAPILGEQLIDLPDLF